MRYTKILFAMGMLFSLAAQANTPQIGLNPVPILQNVGVQTQVSYGLDGDGFTPIYTYTYTVTNPSTNTGDIWLILIDVSAPVTGSNVIPGDFTLPRGGAGNMQFAALLQETYPNDGSFLTNVVPFGITAPAGWGGSLTVNQTGGFFATTGAQTINPGQSLSGLSMFSMGLPTIRTMQLKPDWIYAVDEEASDADEATAANVEQSLIATVPVLGPSYVNAGSDDQYNEFSTDIQTAISLGWISDAGFGNTVLSQFQAARADADLNGLADAAPQFQSLLATIQGSTASQRNDEAFALLYINVQAILNVVPFAPPPSPVPSARIITPTNNVITAPVGSSVTVVQQVVDLANGNAPIVGFQSELRVRSGPDANLRASTNITDGNGEISLTITGKQQGVDLVSIRPSYWPAELGPYQGISIVWTGGADLVINEFTPPLIKLDGQNTFRVTDTTQNAGNTAVGPSNTFYFLSPTYPVDPSTAYVLDERPVPALAPGQSDFSQIDETVPGDLPAGKYYMLACANFDKSQIEVNYDNNCVTSQLVASMERAVSPPVCTSATPSQSLLWPPNHQMVPVSIQGITDPNNLVPAVTITGIQQDEPVNAKGDGNTAPDGIGVGSAAAQVRSERSGIAQGGRLYFISFSATDSTGGSCTGTVTVGVPHDKGQHSMPIDNGQRYDSTQSN